MGGIGSGNWYRWDKNDTVGDCRSLDVRRWQRDGLLTPGRRFTWQWTGDGETVANITVRVETGQVLLSYRCQRNGGEWEDIDELVALDTTPCNYGGHRYWYRCPALGCGRRTAILYGAGRYFACRLCYRLAYESQREAADDRATRRADRIRARLGWEPGILNRNGRKPKGMHWRTFERLTAEHEAFVGESLAEMARRFKLFDQTE